MIASQSPSKPCPNCHGTRKVEVQVTAGNKKHVACPACNGSGEAKLMTK